MPLLAVIGDVHYELDHLHRCLARAAARKVDGLLLVGDLGWHGLGRAKISASDHSYGKPNRAGPAPPMP